MNGVERCFHCGALLEPERFPVRVDGHAQWTCCAGCQAACNTIVELGLASYYANRDAFPARLDAKPAADDLFANLGDGTLADDGYLDAADDEGTRACTLIIDGMRCAACAWLIEKSVARMPGIVGANVNVTSGRALVRWRSGETQLRDVMLRIRRLGYRALPYRSVARDSLIENERRTSLLRLIVAALGMMQVMTFAVGFYTDFFAVEAMETVFRDYFRAVSFVVATPVLFYSGWPFLRSAWFSIVGGMPGMDVPVSLALLLAYFASLWATIQGGPDVYFDAVCMFVFFLSLGRHLELEARRRATRVVDNLSAALPLTATRVSADQDEVVTASRLRAGDRVRVRPGETIPADGRLLEGEGHVNEAMLTGESMPVRRMPGDRLTGGCVNVDGVLLVEVALPPSQGRLSRIVDLVNRAQLAKPQLQEVADRVASWFVAGLLAVTAATWLAWQLIDPSRAFWIALAVLVVSCPCALSLATPVAFTVATNFLTGRGLLLTRGHVLSTLPRVRAVVFDKTGTLTEGRPVVVATRVFTGLNENSARNVAAMLERDSEHPLAQAFHDGGYSRAEEVRVVPGMGIEGVVNGTRYRIGARRFALDPAFAAPGQGAETADAGGLVWLSSPAGALATFRLHDALRAGARELVSSLDNSGIEVHLLSGDASGEAERVAGELGIARVCAGATPEGKVDYVSALRSRCGGPVAMVGDGINDAPVLAAADVSIAMGEGTDLARMTADAVLLRADLRLVPLAMATARRTAQTVRQNLAWSAFYNAAMVPAAIAGWVPPWVASIGMSASSLVVVMNALAIERRSERDAIYPSGPAPQNARIKAIPASP